MKRIFKHILFGVAGCTVALGSVQCSPEDPDTRAAAELAARVVPSIADRIVFVKSAEGDSVDRFSLRSDDGRIVITGNNAGAMATGLNHYLKNYCLTDVSWYAADPCLICTSPSQRDISG